MAKHNTQNRFVKLAIAASLITTAFSSPLNVAGLVRRDDAAKELKLDAKAFGAAIEGASVNKAGDVYAVDFRGKGATSTSSFGFFHQTSGGVDKVVGQDPIVIAKGSEDTFLAGARFVKGGEKVLIAGWYFFDLLSLSLRHGIQCINIIFLPTNINYTFH